MSENHEQECISTGGDPAALAHDGTRHVHVLGADEFHLRQLRRLHRADEYTFHELYRRDDVKSGRTDVVERVLPGATELLARAVPAPDAVVGYWDFPVSAMLPVLRRGLRHPTPSLESVLRCEHKYWSRLEQARSVPDVVPAFCVVDPFADDVASQVTIDPPFWIKPVKSVLSHLGFRIDGVSDLGDALDQIRAGIDRIAIPFDQLMALAELPSEIEVVGGRHCIVEAIISRGRQCTLEGYVSGDGDIVVYAAVDSIREGPQRSSFSRYQYPSELPHAVLDRMSDITYRFISHIGLTDAPFNVEYFWDDTCDEIWLLEVNPRISKSHAPLLRAVDGEYNHQVMLDIALQERPRPPRRDGEHRMAAKFMWRHDRDAVVTRVPDPGEIADVTSGAVIDVEFHVSEGCRLSDLAYQDSYSYELASVFVAGDDEHDLLEGYERCRRRLEIALEPV